MGFATVIKSQSYMTRMMKLSMKLYRKEQVQKKKRETCQPNCEHLS